MKRSFHFRARTVCRANSVIIDVLVIFFGRGPTDITVLTDEIQDALKSDDPIPDALYVVGASRTIDDAARLWLAHPAQVGILLERGNPPGISAIKEHALLEFQGGSFQRRALASSTQVFDIDLQKIFSNGLAQLVSSNGVYQLAPSGHTFKHPSGRHSKQFFLASELLRNDIDVYFVAMCVCAAAWSCLYKATRIFIDTMGIYPIAVATRELLVQAGRAENLPWEIENYHSHDGLKGLEPSIGDSDVALISASTSGGLANTLHRDKNFKHRNIVTLLDVHRTGRIGWVVHSNSDFSEVDSIGPKVAEDSHETPIELVGEYFAARGKKPRALTLATYHAPSDLRKILDCHYKIGDSALNRQRAGGTVDVLSLSAGVVVNDAAFRKWLVDEVRLKTPASATHVIAADALESLSLANLVGDSLEMIQSKRPTVIPYSDLASLANVPVGGVVVCAALTGNGHLLRLISRDLREVCPVASRHFIVGFAAPDSYESWQRLGQFLRQSGTPARPYLVSSWQYVAVGRKRPNDCWSKYAQLMQELDHASPGDLNECEEQEIAKSLVSAASLLEQSSSSFLPSSSESLLTLTEGFVYWQPTADVLAQSSHGPIGYLAITSVLQNAREFDEPSRRLKSSLYETVVLDPENFLRFNDGVLQASLLRAAYTSELDYSMTIEGSQSMREILEKIILNHEKRYGEAALEFAAALAAGHLRLASPDATNLFDKLRHLCAVPGPLSGLIYFWWHRYIRRE